MIDTPSGLAALVERALAAEAVAFDTEFVWERTYYPRLGVVQVGFSAEDCHLIDAVALDDLSPLGRVLAAPGIVKILHDAQQDLTILRRVTNTYPCNIFDTRLAGGFVGLSATLSLGDLVQATVGVYLPKTESRTDWLRRPLSDKQVEYALDDVRHLPAVYDELKARVQAHSRNAWLREELATYNDPTLYDDPDPYAQFERLSGTGRLSAKQRAVARELAAWREHEARRQDRPRGHILNDKSLIEVARRLPRSRNELAAIRRVNDRKYSRYADDWLDAVARGLEVPAADQPARPERPDLDDAAAARVNLVLGYMAGKGLADGIDGGLLANRAAVTALVADAPAADPEDHALLRGWRYAFMGNELLAFLAGRRAIRLDPSSGLPTLTDL